MEEKIDRLLFRVYEHHLCIVFELLNASEIPAILIKGWAAARFYDSPWDRKPGDFDLMVPPDTNIDPAIYFAEHKGILADLHFGPRHLDTLSFEDLLERSRTVDLEGVKVRILCPEDHLRVLCVHWLTDGGERKERLQDVYWAVTNRPKDFDWSKCLDVVPAVRRRWIIATIGLAHKHFGLRIDDLPFEEEARALPEWFTKAIETRWEKDIPHISLHHSLASFDQFFTQVRKRFPPNPVMAMVGTESDLDEGNSFSSQVRYVFKQAGPSIRRLFGVFRTRRG